MKYPVVTICGSMRFYDDMVKEAERLTSEGNIVLMPFVYHNNGVKRAGDKLGEMLDDMHRAKIDMSDSVVVIVGDNYIGQSTRGEIIYAASKGKPVAFVDVSRPRAVQG